MKKALLAILLIAFCASLSFAQAATAAVRGTLKDNGKPLAGAQVVLTNMDSGMAYKATADQEGAFELTGLASASNYQLEVFDAAGQKVFARAKLAFNAEASSSAELAIDASDASNTNLSAFAGNHRYTREEIDALRAQNAKAQEQNALIRQAIDAINTQKWQDAVPPLQQLIAGDPARYEFYQPLGEAQMNLQQYMEAIASFTKGIQVAGTTETDPRNPASDPAKKKSRIVAMLVNEGHCYLKLKQPKEAVAAFTRATELDPNSGVASFDLCATLYNTGQIEAGLRACEKSIALEPGRADTYFIKGFLLVDKSKRDKDGKSQVLPGTIAALRKYLELQPEGPFAPKAKQMLAELGVKSGEANTNATKK